jgi:hypothetical protein
MNARPKFTWALTVGLTLLVGTILGYGLGYVKTERNAILRSEAAGLVTKFDLLLKIEAGRTSEVATALNRQIDHSILVISDLDAAKSSSNAWRMIAKMAQHRTSTGYTNQDDSVAAILEMKP